MRHQLLIAIALLTFPARAQVAADTSGGTPDHWVVVDLKEWAWYLNFTHEQKAAVRGIDAQYADREALLGQGDDYVETEAQREERRKLVAACTDDVRAALDPLRFTRWLDLRNGAQPVKPSAGGPQMRLGIGLF
jgi:hypothetical protein